MTEHDRPGFVTVVEALCAAYGREPDKATLAAYWMGLEDLPLEVLQAAAKQAIRSRRFMATPTELRQLAGELTPEERAVLAWAAVMGTFTGMCPPDSVDLEDPVLHAAVRALGGWHHLGQMETGDQPYERKRFVEYYRIYAEKGVPEEDAGYLPGLQKESARLHGAAPRAPILIGNLDLTRPLIQWANQDDDDPT